MEEYGISKKVLYMNLEKTRLRGRPRNKWQDEVREDGRLVGGKGWKEGYTRVGILIVATIYLQLIQNRYMF